MRAFGIGKRRRSRSAWRPARSLIALWQGADLQLVPHLFLPTPGEVIDAARLRLRGRLRQRDAAGTCRARVSGAFRSRGDRLRARRPHRAPHGPEPMGEGRFRCADRILLAAAAARLSAADDHLARHRRSLEDHVADAWRCSPRSRFRRRRACVRSFRSASTPPCRSAPIAGSSCARSCFPSALPEILTGTRIALGVGWGTLVAAELIAATRGIGYLIMSASQFLATDVVFVGIAIIAACAFAFSLAMRALERTLVPWKGQS